MTTDAVICTDLHGLPAEQNRAVAIKIRRNCPWSKVAAEMGVAESTIWRWRQSYPEIDELVRQAELDNVRAAREKLSASLDTAIDELVKICKDPTVEPRDRIAASSKILDIAAKGKSDSPAGACEGAGRERAGPIANQPARPGLPAVIDVQCDDELDAELARRFGRGSAGVEAEGMDEG